MRTLTPSTKRKMLEVLTNITNTLEKCGGRGGKPGPCAKPKPSSSSSDSQKPSGSSKPPSKPSDKPSRKPAKPVPPKKPDSPQDASRREAVNTLLARVQAVHARLAQGIQAQTGSKPGPVKPPEPAKTKPKPKEEPKPVSKPKPTAPKTEQKPAKTEESSSGFPDRKAPRKLDPKLEETLDRTGKMNSKQKETLTDYTSGAIDYRSINASLREGKALSGQHKKDYDALQDAISAAGPLPKGTTVYRGISLEGKAKDDLVNSFRQSAKDGSTVKMPGLTSTSIDPQAAASFSRGGKGPVVFEIKPKSGAYVSKLSPFDAMAKKAGKSGENEVLLADGKKYRVVAVQDDVTIGQKKTKGWGHTVIQLEEA